MCSDKIRILILNCFKFPEAYIKAPLNERIWRLIIDFDFILIKLPCLCQIFEYLRVEFLLCSFSIVGSCFAEQMVAIL